MARYWLARKYRDCEGWELEGPYDSLPKILEELMLVLEAGADTPVKLFRELVLDLKDMG